MNPYGPCVTNKYVGDGEQLTVIKHMDDLMGSCADNFKLTKLSCYLAKIYGPKLMMHTGMKHEYLGMNFEFKTSGDLQVSMVRYLKDVIMGFPELIVGKAAMPAGDRLFNIQDKKDARPLEEERANAFHHTKAQLLFMATRACWDIQTAVAFLTTRVKAPNEDYWGKLKRVLPYLKGTKYLKLTISVEDLGILKWYMGGSHNVHWDCKGHAGAMFTLEGRGSEHLLKETEKGSTKPTLCGIVLFKLNTFLVMFLHVPSIDCTYFTHT